MCHTVFSQQEIFIFSVSCDVQKFCILRLSLHVTKDSQGAKVIPRREGSKHIQRHMQMHSQARRQDQINLLL